MLSSVFLMALMALTMDYLMVIVVFINGIVDGSIVDLVVGLVIVSSGALSSDIVWWHLQWRYMLGPYAGEFDYVIDKLELALSLINQSNPNRREKNHSYIR